MTKAFDHILNWRLLKGNHEFPGPDGGTCINEAAIVAAGLPYREIKHATDCPPCFCRTLAAYALGLNDEMSDDERQGLMPFVLRLSGSADRRDIEEARANLILMETTRQMLAPIADIHGLNSVADQCRSISIPGQISQIEDSISNTIALSPGKERHVFDCSRNLSVAYLTRLEGRRYYNITKLVQAVKSANFLIPAWPIAISILDDALKIGRQAPPLDLAVVRERMDAARLGEIA